MDYNKINNFISKTTDLIIQDTLKKVDEFLISCFKELGYAGSTSDLEAIGQFTTTNNINIIFESLIEICGTKYTVKCEKLNYEKSLIIQGR